MSELLEVGRIVKPHGLKGQVVVELWTNRTERVARGALLTGPTGELRVTRSSQAATTAGRDRWLVGFEGVDTRESAEALRGTVLMAAPIDEPGSLWIHELVGQSVFEVSGGLPGELLGVVEAVEANPASDLLVLGNGMLIPLTFVVDTDVSGLRVELPEGLREL